MPNDETPFLLPPPSPVERRTTLRVILALSAVLHLGLLAFAARATREPQTTPIPSRETVQILRGEVTTDSPEPGLRLLGYAEVAAPTTSKR